MSAGAQEDNASRSSAEPSRRVRQSSRQTRPSASDAEGRPRHRDARRTGPARRSNARTQGGHGARDQRKRSSQRSGTNRREHSGHPSRSSRRQRSQSLPERFLGGVYRHRRSLIALGIVLVVFLSLYGPVQRYYVAWRTQGDEQAKADYLNSDNDALKQDIDRLTTRSGVENEARERGYRYPNEDANTSANVATNDSDQGSDALNSGFSYDDIQHPWYVDVLDFVFMYTSPEN